VVNQMPDEWLPRRLDRLRKKLWEHRSSVGKASARLPFVKMEADLGWGRPHPRRFPSEILSSLLDSIPGQARPTLILCIDEAHRPEATPGNKEGVNQVLLEYHKNAGMRALALFAGHSHTPDVLEASISGRFASGNRPPMKRLTNGEPREYALGIMGFLQVGGTEAERSAVADWVARECSNWPHHLRNAMSAIAEESLLSDSLNPPDWNGKRIEDRLNEAREEYYDQRLSRGLDRSRTIVHLLRDALSGWNGACLKSEMADRCAEVLAELKKSHPNEARRLKLAGLNEDSLLMDRLIEQGVIAQTKDDNDREWEFAIPSLADYARDGFYKCRGFPLTKRSAGPASQAASSPSPNPKACA